MIKTQLLILEGSQESVIKSLTGEWRKIQPILY
jgi:hypothetical protein